jgi:hypothetical protein
MAPVTAHRHTPGRACTQSSPGTAAASQHPSIRQSGNPACTTPLHTALIARTWQSPMSFCCRHCLNVRPLLKHSVVSTHLPRSLRISRHACRGSCTSPTTTLATTTEARGRGTQGHATGDARSWPQQQGSRSRHSQIEIALNGSLALLRPRGRLRVSLAGYFMRISRLWSCPSRCVTPCRLPDTGSENGRVASHGCTSTSMRCCRR